MGRLWIFLEQPISSSYVIKFSRPVKQILINIGLEKVDMCMGYHVIVHCSALVPNVYMMKDSASAVVFSRKLMAQIY